jgi:hypothetical protein
MVETKSQLTDRLRREDREEEATRYRNQIREQLKAEGKKRQEAREGAWDALRAAFPPLPPSEKIGPPAAFDNDTVGESWAIEWFSPLHALAEWKAKHGVALTDAALKELLQRFFGFGFAWAFMLGARGDRPPGYADKHFADVSSLIERTFERMADAVTAEGLATFLPAEHQGMEASAVVLP